MSERVAPGFVDLQVNGGFGHDFTVDPTTIWDVGRLLPRFGVTAFVPTVITSRPDVPATALAVLAAGPPPGWSGARPLGLHLEGPMISPARLGAHPEHLVAAAETAVARTWLETGTPLMVTIAPELEGASAVIGVLAEAGVVVALGHSECTAEEAAKAFAGGATHVTHLFNAMSGLDHRRPGLAAAALTGNVTVGLVVDGVHVDPVMVDLAFRILGPERIALVSDAMAGLGMDSGRYWLGETEVEVDGGTTRDPGGALAGGVVGIDVMMRNMVRFTGCSPDEAVAMASSTPARIVGHDPDPSDEVHLADDLSVVATVIGGEVAYRSHPR